MMITRLRWWQVSHDDYETYHMWLWDGLRMTESVSWWLARYPPITLLRINKYRMDWSHALYPLYRLSRCSQEDDGRCLMMITRRKVSKTEDAGKTLRFLDKPYSQPKTNIHFLHMKIMDKVKRLLYNWLNQAYGGDGGRDHGLSRGGGFASRSGTNVYTNY